MRVAVLNDIGQPSYHVGDEAMAHAAVAELQVRGVTDVLLLTRDEEHTRHFFGAGIATARTLEFPWQPAERRRHLQRVLAVIAGNTAALPPEDPVHALLEQLRDVDALLVAGGGNLNSTYGWLLYERAAIVRIASALGKRVVVSGQTLGPVLSDADTPVLKELLEASALVGLRESRSLALARRLCPDHPALHGGYDDATFIAEGPVGRPSGDDAEAGARSSVQIDAPGPDGGPRKILAVEAEGSEKSGRPRIVATFAPGSGPFEPEEAAAAYAALLDALVRRTGATVSFLPHMAHPGQGDGDEAFHAQVAGLMTSGAELQTIDSARRTAELTASADYVVTSRYHPVVFGLTGGATVLPVAVDTYADVRMQGALDNWGFAEQAVPLAALLTPGDNAWDTHAAVQQWAAEAVERREAVHLALTETVPHVRSQYGQWWDAVVDVLGGGRPNNLPTAVSAPPRGVGAQLPAALRHRYTTPQVPSERPAVAIVMRTKDRSVLLRRALDDVLLQTFTDWRLVVVNDGGAPGPVDELIARRADAFAGRATVLHHRRSVGMEAATNRGLRALDSEFVVVHDDDDQWHPTFLQRTVAHLEDPRTTDDGVMVRTVIVYEEVEGDSVIERGREILEPDLRSITLVDLMKANRGVPISFLYRRAVHGVLGDYDESLPVVGDWEFHLRFVQTFTIGFLDGRPLAIWNQRPGQTGPLRNSVFDPSHAHHTYDLQVRERHFQQWVDENGIGLPLYLTKAVEREAVSLHHRMDRSEELARELLDLVRHQNERIAVLENVVADNSFFGYLKRKWRRLVRR
ncbi:polysaccharide pyruvyl transferase family protein [Kocuria sp. SM24M-10]|uniref:polysaccharide pyruvyl transferase family protein n=1 Tax=Kocuria sp. SM24M-10 TaxID=1660349 RepID=UPI00069CA63D|nr:polysaccharide pyruvyl transferase family protein [Kocuria sp. SM24M-10]